MARRHVVTTDERLGDLPIEALACRELRHAWPRLTDRGATVLTPLRTRGGRITEAERQMECTGNCGTIRTDTFAIWPNGRMTREGKPRYRRTKPYLLKAPEPGIRADPVDRDVVRHTLLTRMYPDLQW